MKLTSKRMVFGMALVVGAALVLTAPIYKRLTLPPEVPVKVLTSTISVAEQVTLAQVPRLRVQGFGTIIDLRPDGEVAGQPTAAQVQRVAGDNGMQFAYVPVPHGEIADSAVDALQTAIDNGGGPVLLYCRSGRRAARTWSLVEASNPHGMDARSILAAVKNSGQTADDLTVAINARIALRTSLSRAIK
jgi:uncharacterized protein (TIGR01244 family)